MKLLRLQIFALCLLLISPSIVLAKKHSIDESALTVENGKAHVDYGQLKADTPWNPVAVGLLSGVGGAAFGGVLMGLIAIGNSERGRRVDQEAVNTVALFGAVVGGLGAGIWKLVDNIKWRNAYNKAHGLNLHGCAAKDNKEGAEALLKYDKSMALVEDTGGRIALHYGAAKDAKGATAAILQHGPREYQIATGTEKTKSVTKTSGWVAVADAFTGEKNWKAPRETESVKTTYTLGKVVDKPDNSGSTPAHYAAECGAAETFKVLLKNGANSHKANSFDKTPLEIARGNPLMSLVVLQFGGK